MVNINLYKRLTTLKSNLKTTAINSYKVGTVKKPIFITSLANNSSSSVLFTLSALSLAVLPWALKTAFNSSSIFSI